MSDNIRRVAFTLAEVLITLGIIGIVAAMTIPTISHNIQQAVLKNQFKKFYSTFWQAVIGIQTKEGRPVQCYYWDGTNPYTGKCTPTCDEDERMAQIHIRANAPRHVMKMKKINTVTVLYIGVRKQENPFRRI